MKTLKKNSFSTEFFKIFFIIFVFVFLTNSPLKAQTYPADLIDIDNDDLQIGGDIFSDYNEDLEAVQVVEDERYFRYGRFFSFGIGVGNTTFTGNRGAAYVNEPPAFGINISYFLNFRVSYTLGFEFSKHNFAIDAETKGFSPAPGLVEVSMLRPYFGIRYHVDTSDLGTALTYSNPYFTARVEYWYQKNKFPETDFEGTQSGGGVGIGLGGGLEFPIVLKEYYIGVEMLYHKVNYFDKYTTDLRAPPSGSEAGAEYFQDLTGDSVSFLVSYIVNW